MDGYHVSLSVIGVFLMLLEGSHLGNFDLTNEADGRSVKLLGLLRWLS